ncbi:hypothetical protein LINGRAPRIM_LOCUS330, partial [Linum grandiflorum]
FEFCSSFSAAAKASGHRSPSSPTVDDVTLDIRARLQRYGRIHSHSSENFPGPDCVLRDSEKRD